jgi:hypothetical protein
MPVAAQWCPAQDPGSEAASPRLGILPPIDEKTFVRF